MPASISVLDSTGTSQTVNTLPALGQAVKSASLPVAIASDDDIQAKLGILTETAPSTDTGSSGLNGRLQRLAQRLTSLIALLPATLGQTTKAASLGVALASDDPVVTATGTQADAAWASGNGTVVGLLKAIASAALDTTTDSPVAPHQPSALVTFTPTLSTSAYAAGNVLFATAPISLMRANGLRAALMSMTVVDKTKQTPAFTIFFYQSNVTSAAVNTANNLSDSDALSYIGHLSVAAGDYKTLANNSFAVYKSINLLLQAASGTTNVYAVGVLDAGTPTFALGDLQLGFGVVQS